jgi:hypothetical protein
MKKAAMVLGIIGGSLAILISLFYVLAFGMHINVGPSSYSSEEYSYSEEYGSREWDTPWSEPEYTPDFNPGASRDFSTTALVLLVIMIIPGMAGGGLGIAGGILAEKKNVMAGVFMCVGAVITALFCITFILLLLGGIFALVKGKDDPVRANP